MGAWLSLELFALGDFAELWAWAVKQTETF